jgi:tetratricopeptide (TPR) repeat protein
LTINFPKRLFLIFYLSLSVCALWADESQVTLADFYYEQGFYDEAITEYLRFIYFNPEVPYLAEIYEKMALCYAELEDWEKAEHAIHKAISLANGSDQKYTITFTFIEILIAKKSYSRAEKELLEIYTMTVQDRYRMRSIFLLSVVYIYSYRWELVDICLREYFESSDTYSESVKNQIYDLLTTARELPYKSKEAAVALSLLLPGAGQAYSGKVMQGLNALVVNGAAGTLLVYTILDGYYIDAVVVFLFIFYRFYSGNIYYAEQYALQYNELLNQNIAQQILELLLKKQG